MIQIITNNKYFFLAVYASISLLFFVITLYLNIDLENFLSLVELNKNQILYLDNTLFYKITIIFILLTIIWTFFLGIGLPLILFSSFFYDVFLGTLILVASRTAGSTMMYLIFKKFFSLKIRQYLKKKN